VGQNMSFARTGGGESLEAAWDSALKGLLSGVGSHVLLQGRLLIPSLSTSFKGANKGLLSSVDSGMDKKVGGSKEGLATSMEGTNMGLASLVVSSVVINKISLAGEFTSAMGIIAKESLGVVGLPVLHGFFSGNFLTG